MPRITRDDYNALITRKPHLAPDGEGPCAIAKQGARNPLAVTGEVKASNPRKRLVRITCFRAKHLQDPDNGIYKWHIDALRRAGLLDDDTAQAIRLEIQPEVKVATVEEERVEIEVSKL